MVAIAFLRSARSSRVAFTLRNNSSSNKRFSSSTSANSSKHAGTKTSSAEAADESFFTQSWKIPAASGFALIALLQFYHLNNPTEDERKHHPAPALRRLPGDLTHFETTMATERQMASLKLIPNRAISRVWGQVHDKELPMWLRAPVYNAWTRVFSCKLDEMRFPLQEYRNLGEFFARPLKDGARVFDPNPNCLASPVDGTVASIGVVEVLEATTPVVPTLEQIKGARYRLDEFLGALPPFFAASTAPIPNPNSTQKTPAAAVQKPKKLFHCVLYLAPGDYHRIHAPVDWRVTERRHFPGNLFPVNSVAARLIPSLFVENERVALLGEWAYGFFSLTAVGATNVGSITLTNEPAFATNTKEQDTLVGKCLSKLYNSEDKGIAAQRGDEMAQFKLGSTVVLVFEAPADFEFTIEPGDKLILGKCIGRVA